jgi:hypothetical protein
MSNPNLPVAVIGAGPIGLAAVAHLLQRGETAILFEAGETVGSSILSWQHVRMFSTWEINVDYATVEILEANGWTMPPRDGVPTGGELVHRYLAPFASLPEVASYIHTGSKVLAISRRHTDKMKDAERDNSPFVLHVECNDGSETFYEAKAVIDASGTWKTPNPIGAHGLVAPGEKANHEHIEYGIPDILGKDSQTYANQRVMVVGSGHSAINALLDLAVLREDYPETQAVWVMRGSNLQGVFGGELNDALPARGALGTRMRALMESGGVQILNPFFLERIENTEDGLEVWGDTDEGRQSVVVDRIIGTTGSRPDLTMLRELRLNLDPSLESTALLAPMIDPNIHSCGTVRPHGEAELRQPETNFYMVGMKSYGRAPSFLLATGYEQVRSVVAYLAGDFKAAKEVYLNLPETGICSSDLVYASPKKAVQAVATKAAELIPVLNILNNEESSSSCCGPTCCS